MPIPLHLTLKFITNIAALIGGFMLGMSVHEVIQADLPPIFQEKGATFIIFGMLPAGVGYLLSELVFRYLITGQCPKCKGRAIYHASRLQKSGFGGKTKIPITYHCQECGHIHRTSIYPARPMNPH